MELHDIYWRNFKKTSSPVLYYHRFLSYEIIILKVLTLWSSVILKQNVANKFQTPLLLYIDWQPVTDELRTWLGSTFVSQSWLKEVYSTSVMVWTTSLVRPFQREWWEEAQATNTVKYIFGACFTESRAAFDLTMLMLYTCRMPSLPTAPLSRLPILPPSAGAICWSPRKGFAQGRPG